MAVVTCTSRVPLTARGEASYDLCTSVFGNVKYLVVFSCVVFLTSSETVVIAGCKIVELLLKKKRSMNEVVD